ncbi:collagen alpha-1(XII) chain-like isoform X3 [Dreissena polymorpha]|uniref:collagen alpha-1(XII) chain-like isoform X3 n=1 Tax=Dreissena polymorpha TaxID=45954 RepID=UPI0022656DA9|nr:collagen alpha-1(XII) chain-like isoform X3 [Dreissena polymorpha]
MCTCLKVTSLWIVLATANITYSEKCSTSTMADIVFMVDGSGSVGSAGFQSAKAFMSQFVDLFNIGPSHTQIGVMIYSSQITFPILLKSYSDANELKNAINGISYQGGSEDTSEALRQLVSTMFIETNGKRSNATQIVIIVTDGAADSSTVSESNNVKCKSVVIYVASVTTYSGGIFDQVASGIKYFMSINDYSYLQTLVGPLAVAACEALHTCLPTTCQNGGTCHVGSTAYSCECPAIYTGWHCDLSICSASPCGNRGQCKIEGNTWKCTCYAGYTGATCSTNINECESSPSQNGGACIDKVNMFECVCADGYYNLQCETNICQPTMADVIFLLDSSVSQSRDQFTRQLDFVNQFIDHVVVGTENFQFAVVTFSFAAKVEIRLAEFNDNATLKEAVRNISFRPGGTFTHKGLQTVSQLVANSSSARPFNHSARRYVVLLTDGMSINRAETKRVAKSLKQQIFKLIAIGVGPEVSHRELLDIASLGDKRTPQYVFAVSNFNALFTIVAQLVHLTCQECTWDTATDVVFLIDMSTGMSQVEVDLGIDAMTYLLNALLDTRYNTTVRAALLSYGNEFRVHRTLDEPMESLRDYIQILTVPKYCDASGDDDCDVIRSLSRAFAHLNTSMFKNNENNTREVIVMISNGRHDIDTSVRALANDLVRTGKIVLAIGVGDSWKVDSFKQMVEDPSHIYTVESKESVNVLDSVMTEIVYSSCALSNDFNNKP